MRNPEKSENFVWIAKNRAEVGPWEKAEDFLRKMRDKGFKKICGWI